MYQYYLSQANKVSGALVGSTASVDGVIDHLAILTGDLVGSAAATSGTVENLATLTGDLVGSAATVSGAIENVITLTGDLVGSAASISGLIDHLATLTGELVGSEAVISGAIDHIATLTEDLVGSVAVISGTIDNVITLTGVLVGSSAIISGVIGEIVTLEATLVASEAVVGCDFRGNYYADYTNGLNSNDGRTPANAWKDWTKIKPDLPIASVLHLFPDEEWPETMEFDADPVNEAQRIFVKKYGAGSVDPIMAPREYKTVVRQEHSNSVGSGTVTVIGVYDSGNNETQITMVGGIVSVETVDSGFSFATKTTAPNYGEYIVKSFVSSLPKIIMVEGDASLEALEACSWDRYRVPDNRTVINLGTGVFVEGDINNYIRFVGGINSSVSATIKSLISSTRALIANKYVPTGMVPDLKLYSQLAMNINNKTFFTFENIRIEDSLGIAAAALTDTTFIDCYLEDIVSGGAGSSIDLGNGATDVLFNGVTVDTDKANVAAIFGNGTTRVEFRNGVIKEINGDGIKWQGSIDCVVANSSIGPAFYGLGVGHQDGIVFHSATSIGYANVTNFVVENCSIFGWTQNLYHSHDHNDGVTDGVTIRGCRIYNDGSYSESATHILIENGTGFTSSISNVDIFANTFGWAGATTVPAAITFAKKSGTITNLVGVNNIFYEIKTTSGGVAWDITDVTGSVTIDNNCYYMCTSNSGEAESNSIIADPLLKNYDGSTHTKFDFHLTVSSPCINAGHVALTSLVTLPSPWVDYDNNTRSGNDDHIGSDFWTATDATVSGDLVGSGASIQSELDLLASISGSLVGSVATISGSLDLYLIMTGPLVGYAATTSGTVSVDTTRDLSGELVGIGGQVFCELDAWVSVTNGALIGSTAVINGSLVLITIRVINGVLVGSIATSGGELDLWVTLDGSLIGSLAEVDLTLAGRNVIVVPTELNGMIVPTIGQLIG